MMPDSTTVHLWQANISLLLPWREHFLTTLDAAESQRAARLKPLRANRFICARGLLREILGLYLGMPAKEILLAKGPHQKPFLNSQNQQPAFNLSHSGDMLVYAIGRVELGVDIEKIRVHFNPQIEDRFFDRAEKKSLLALSGTARAKAFCKIWSGREAVIKMAGESIFSRGNDFAVEYHKSCQLIRWRYGPASLYYLPFVPAQPDYILALASAVPVKKIEYLTWKKNAAPEIIHSRCFSPK